MSTRAGLDTVWIAQDCDLDGRTTIVGVHPTLQVAKERHDDGSPWKYWPARSGVPEAWTNGSPAGDGVELVRFKVTA